MAMLGSFATHRRLAVFTMAAMAIGVLVGRWTATPNREESARLIEFLPGSGRIAEGTAELSWRFSTPMVDRPGPIDADDAPFRFTPPIAGTFVWVSDRELTFRPAQPWLAGRAYEIEATDGAVDLRGRRIEPPGRLQLRAPALDLLRVEQADASIGGTKLRLDFNAPPNRAALARLLEVRLADSDSRLPIQLLGDAISTTVLVHVPAPPGSVLDVALPAGLPPHEGTLAVEAARRVRIQPTTALALTRLSPRTPSFDAPEIDAYFTAAIDPETAAAFIRIDPDTRRELRRLDRWDGSGLTLSGEFEPGRVYVLTFAAGLPSEHGGRLDADVVRHVQFPDRPPSLAFPREGEYLSPHGPMAVPLTVVNAPECEVSLGACCRTIWCTSRCGGRTATIRGTDARAKNATVRSPYGPPRWRRPPTGRQP